MLDLGTSDVGGIGDFGGTLAGRSSEGLAGEVGGIRWRKSKKMVIRLV